MLMRKNNNYVFFVLCPIGLVNYQILCYFTQRPNFLEAGSIPKKSKTLTEKCYFVVVLVLQLLLLFRLNLVFCLCAK